MSEPEDEAAEAEEAYELEEVPQAMTGSAAPEIADPVAEVLGDSDEPAPAQEGYPITIALDSEGNGSAHVGIFTKDIESVEIDDVDPECIFAGEAAVGISVIEVRGASTRSKPVSGFVIVK